MSDERLRALSARLKAGPLPPPTDFTRSRETPFFPPRGAAWAAAFFFMAVKHLFGLWREDQGRFAGPVRGRVDGRLFEGEDFVWMALSRTVQEEPDFLLPAAQASLDRSRMAHALRDDAGECPVPLVEAHAELARAHGAALLDLKWTPHKILQETRAVPQGERLGRFVEILSQLPGYREDRLQRKSFLLAMILAARPEGFLSPGNVPWPPVLDRHMLRVALRWGAVDAADPAMRPRLAEGAPVPPPVEEQVRLAAYDVFSRLLSDAGCTVPGTFSLFSAARQWCPEDRPPDCPACFFSDACARRTELQAPVMRTTSY